MDLADDGGNESGDEGMAAPSSSRKGKKTYHRHSTQQIQQLEAAYKECPHPDKNQREQLSQELGLDQKQIKFWFQNKRTQVKAQNEKANNSTLRSENERIHYENLAMQEALKNIICPNCNSLGLGEEETHRNLQRLRMENARLKEEHERTMNFFSNYMGNSSSGALPRVEVTNPLEPEQVQPFNPENPISTDWSYGTHERDKPRIVEKAISAMEEFLELLRVNEPVWIKAPTEDRLLLHRDSYDKLFPKPSQIKTTSARYESSRESGEVAMAAIHLVEMMLDANKWKDMFPNIVNRARTIEVVDAGSFGGLLHLMYQKLHILSPLVAPRELFVIRYCRQLNPNTWMVVDVSHEFIKEFLDTPPTRSWKLPSGCLIEDLANGKSKITWIEHVQVDDKALTHRLFRELVCGCQAYGAKRWIATLQRMCERFAFSMGLTITNRNELEGVIDSIEGRRNLMRLSHRMIKDFSEALSMSEKLEFPHLSEFKNSGVRVSLRRSVGIGTPEGFIVSASTSIWLPVSSVDLFKFFKDEKKRSEWDVLASGNPINAVARISTGTDPGNCISIIQPFIPKESNMLMLEETSVDSLGGALIYAPMDLAAIVAVINGEDTERTPILPSGYVISGDGRPDRSAPGAASSSKSTPGSSSLLTATFQILVCHNQLSKELNMESVATIHALISSTIQKIKTALDCAD
ncbi:homeobox-leucine zipper protein ROC8-like [Andrographis paniculata]|uniref:homeobox-leucine zipper protein ROC8-like n=1 Tax=Andrographis paniculata TaxID=175694 RepID=UPI0021E8614C|nr:homeobox-leucine zipper protein ROC8-like [Andrographis paniculata]